MKEERGFTLIELMVVVSICAILAAWAVPAYTTWNTKHKIETQMVQLYSDLQYTRMYAYGNKVVSGVSWANGASIPASNSYPSNSYQLTYVNGAGASVTIAAVNVSTGINISNLANGQLSVSFDGRGFLNTPGSASPIVFSVTPSSGAGIDCVSVYSTRITLGKMNGGTCWQK